jgi:hypothetical protein
MDPLAFIAKTIGTTARIGAAVFLGAGLVVILRWMNVEPLASIDKATYGAIIAAGIFGVCTVAVEFIITGWWALKRLFLHVVAPLWAAKVQRARNRKTALKNLQSPRPEFVATLRYLKAHNLKRFSAPAPWNNIVLREMEQSFLIEIDDPNYPDGRSHNTYYSVRDCVWDRIECPVSAYPTEPLAESPPWL